MLEKMRTAAAFAVMSTTIWAAPAHADEYRIGVLHAMTGNVGFVGVSEVNGTILGAEEWNKNPKNADKQIKLIVEDTASERGQAMTLVSKLANRDNALMILGPTSSIESLAAAPVANQAGIALYTPAVSSDIFKAGPWAFKAVADSDAYMRPVGKYAVETLTAKRVAVIFDRQNDSTVTQKNNMIADLQKGGATITSENGVLGSDTDFTVIATKVVSENPDVVFVSAQAHVGANIIIQLKQAGLAQDVRLLGSMNMSTPTLLKLGGKAVEGVTLVGDFAPDGATDAAKAFIEAYKKRFNNPPDNFAAVGYAQMQVLSAILEKLGPKPTREAVREAFASAVRNVPTVLGTGAYSISDKREVQYTPVLLRVSNGQFVAAK